MTQQREQRETMREGRVTREQATHEAMAAASDSNILFEDSGPLPEIPARDGYAQRWIRIAQGGNAADRRNLVRADQRGWKARPADTCPKGFQHLTLKNEQFGGVIGTHDLVLMERPIEIQQRAAAHSRNKTRELEQAVRHQLFRDNQNLMREGPGFGAMRDESSARTEVGRAVQIPDDD